MKFKILKGTETFKLLMQLSEKIESVRQNAKDLVKEFGATKFAHDQHSLAGGISGIQFDEKPEGWRQVGESYQHLYYPKADKKMKSVRDKIDADSFLQLGAILQASHRIEFLIFPPLMNVDHVHWIESLNCQRRDG